MPEGADLLRAARPSPGLAAKLTRLAGHGNRYAACDDATVLVAAGRWAAVEAYAAAMKLAAVAEAIRRSPDQGCGAGMASAGDMPLRWEFGMEEQTGLELSCSPGSAGRVLEDSWQLAARLPLTWEALRDGIIDLPKARMIVTETSILSDTDALEAERQLSGYWADKTWAQLHARITRIVVNLDPAAVEKKREQAQRDDAKVRFWRESTGAAALAGYGLPPDEALQADARIQARARAYRKAGIGGTMDQLRAAAYLDLINGSDARDRLGLRTSSDDADGGRGPDDADDAGADDAAEGPEDDGNTQHCGADVDENSRPGDEGDGSDGAGGVRPRRGGPTGSGPGGGSTPAADAGQGEYGEGFAANLDLTLPLATLTGLAERAGEAARLGAIDPALVRNLANAAIRNPGSTIRVIITGPDGRAAGFGIARERKKRDTRRGNPPPSAPTRPAGPAGQPATPQNRREPPAADGERGDSAGATDSTHEGGGMSDSSTRFAFWPVPSPVMLPLDDAAVSGAGTRAPSTRGADAGIAGAGGAGMGGAAVSGAAVGDGAWGTWRLAAGGRDWDVDLIPLPAPGPCGHEHATASYQPGRTLRNLVQIRDGQCAMTTCGRPASGAQWEHGIPWPAGQTCSCNGGLHCVRHHRVKDQASGWTITQLPDGRRRWTTPKGLTYTSQHRQYPD